MKRINTIASFRVRISATSDKKKLKDGNKTYTYGTISIRDPKLNEFIGTDVIVKVLKTGKKSVSK
jgi:hypothetical protein